MPKKIIAVLLSVLVIVTAFALPTFAADDGTAIMAEEEPIQYATNLVPFPYKYSSNNYEVGTSVYKAGLTFTFQSDGGIHVSGTTTTGVTLAICDPFDLREGTYTVSGYFPSTDTLGEIGVIVRKRDASGNNVGWIGQGYNSRSTGTLVDDESVYYVAVFVGDGETVDGTVYPMLNMGDFAAPYMLYLPYLLEQQYNNGYTNGEAAGNQAGYDQGYAEGESAGYDTALGELDNMTTGVFESAAFIATVCGNAPSSGVYYERTFEFTPNFVYSGVFFSTLYDQINTFLISIGDEYWDYVDRVNIEMVWTDENIFDYQILPLYISGDYDVNYGVLYTVSGKSFELDASNYTSGDKRKLTINTNSIDPLMVNRILIRVGRPVDLLKSFTLYSPSESYGDGYADGYASGYLDGEGVGYINGGNAIYKEAFNKGKAEGLSLSEDGSWRSLMLSVVEAPINTFQSLFNFEVLGLDMRAAFGSILAVCVVLLILKKVIF